VSIDNHFNEPHFILRGKCGQIFDSVSSSYFITKLGQGGLFRHHHSHHLAVSSVFVQVVVFLLDDNLKEVYGASRLQFDEHVGTDCVCA
jgi:hypothetical protein